MRTPKPVMLVIVTSILMVLLLYWLWPAWDEPASSPLLAPSGLDSSPLVPPAVVTPVQERRLSASTPQSKLAALAPPRQTATASGEAARDDGAAASQRDDSPGSARESAPSPRADDDAGIRHPITRDGIRAAMQAARPELNECYENWRKMHPDLGSRVVVNLTIDTDDGVEGRISDIQPLDRGSGLGHLAADGCLLASLTGLRFEPPLSGPLRVTYPFTFTFASDAGL